MQKLNSQGRLGFHEPALTRCDILNIEKPAKNSDRLSGAKRMCNTPVYVHSKIYIHTYIYISHYNILFQFLSKPVRHKIYMQLSPMSK